MKPAKLPRLPKPMVMLAGDLHITHTVKSNENKTNKQTLSVRLEIIRIIRRVGIFCNAIAVHYANAWSATRVCEHPEFETVCVTTMTKHFFTSDACTKPQCSEPAKKATSTPS